MLQLRLLAALAHICCSSYSDCVYIHCNVYVCMNIFVCRYSRSAYAAFRNIMQWEHLCNILNMEQFFCSTGEMTVKIEPYIVYLATLWLMQGYARSAEATCYTLDQSICTKNK